MAEVIILKEKKQETVRRVAAYCRVSTNMEEQQGSLRTQITAFRELISTKESWKMVDVYTDEGISGTQAAHREGFNRMLQDCRDGKIDYIITKSISRFARNTLECLSYIRELKAIGIYIIFEENGLDTGAETSELVLSILAAVAQEESRTISSNVKWGFAQRFKAGIAKWSPTYGYKKENGAAYTINEETAPVVRRIFMAYACGASLPDIIRGLEADKIPSPNGGTRWWPKVAADILCNEKYIGDALLQKSYTVDHLTHRRVKNKNAEVESYYIKAHHDAIIDRKTFRIVQTVRSLKDTRLGAIQYPYYGFLICPLCGKLMVRNIISEHGRPAVWLCGENCRDYYIYERHITEAFLRAYAKEHSQSLSNVCNRIWPRLEADVYEKMCEAVRVEYYMLEELAEYITFQGNDVVNWHFLQIKWKNGCFTQTELHYSRERDIPESASQQIFISRLREKLQEKKAEKKQGKKQEKQPEK